MQLALNLQEKYIFFTDITALRELNFNAYECEKLKWSHYEEINHYPYVLVYNFCSSCR
jgi:hypothetical protein